MRVSNLMILFISVFILCMYVGIFLILSSNSQKYLEQQLGVHAEDTASSLAILLAGSVENSDKVMIESRLQAIFDKGFFNRIEVFYLISRFCVRIALCYVIRPDFNRFQTFVMSIPNALFAHGRGGNRFEKFQILEGILGDKIWWIGRMSLRFLKQDKIKYYLCRSVYELSGGSFVCPVRFSSGRALSAVEWMTWWSS